MRTLTAVVAIKACTEADVDDAQRVEPTELPKFLEWEPTA